MIIGDVNPGAKIIAKGNIVILGSLKGNAYAGAAGDESCFVTALDMDPVQIKIGNVIGRSADRGRGKRYGTAIGRWIHRSRWFPREIS